MDFLDFRLDFRFDLRQPPPIAVPFASSAFLLITLLLNSLVLFNCRSLGFNLDIPVNWVGPFSNIKASEFSYFIGELTSDGSMFRD